MALQRLLLIRHAEKQMPGGQRGVSAAGAPDPTSLTVRGWQRSGALVRLFAPLQGRQTVPWPAPAVIFAAAPAGEHRNRRPALTVGPLAQALRLDVHERFAIEDPPERLFAAIDDALVSRERPADEASAGTALVCWRHLALPALAGHLAGPAARLPRDWPHERFDLVWMLERDGASGRTWRFSQHQQRLLPGDANGD